MRRLLISVAATIGLALSTFGQGAVILDNMGSPGGVVHLAPPNYYVGPFGIQLWELNGTAVPGNINSLSGVNCSQAYANLTADAFTLEATASGTIAANTPGSFALGLQVGEIHMPNVTPPGGNCVLGVAFWEGTSATFLGANYAGVLAFVNPTSNYTAGGPPVAPSLDGWDSAPGGVPDPNYPGGIDLVTSLVPEPGAVALASLGAALLAFRGRK